MKNTFTLLSLIFFASVGLSQANVVVEWSNSGGDVVASYSGTLDLTGYLQGIFVSNVTDIRLGPSENVFRGNVPVSDLTHFRKQFDAYVDSGFTIPNRFGTFNGAEQAFGFYADRGSFPSELYVSPGYVNGSQINGKAVFPNTTVLEIFGTETFDTKVFNDGVNTVTFSTIPESATLTLLGLGSLALVMTRKRE